MSGSPEPAGSDSSSFDSGRGSEAPHYMGAVHHQGTAGGGGNIDPMAGAYNQAGHLGTMRGVKSLPSGKKSRHAAPAPMYGDHRMEDDCWQPRTGIQESNTLPNNNRLQQQQQQLNNPDIPTKGGILITPSRQILQPPASNHEKWNVPRDTTSTFKGQNQTTSPPNTHSNNNHTNGAPQATNTSSNSNGNINRLGLTELEPIAENFALERKRDQQQSQQQHNYIPDIVKSSGGQAVLLNSSGSNQSLKQHSQQQQQPSYSPAPVTSVRASLPPKRTPPSVPLDNDPRTAVV